MSTSSVAVAPLSPLPVHPERLTAAATLKHETAGADDHYLSRAIMPAPNSSLSPNAGQNSIPTFTSTRAPPPTTHSSSPRLFIRSVTWRVETKAGVEANTTSGTTPTEVQFCVRLYGYSEQGKSVCVQFATVAGTHNGADIALAHVWQQFELVPYAGVELLDYAPSFEGPGELNVTARAVETASVRVPKSPPLHKTLYWYYHVPSATMAITYEETTGIAEPGRRKPTVRVLRFLLTPHPGSVCPGGATVIITTTAIATLGTILALYRPERVITWAAEDISPSSAPRTEPTGGHSSFSPVTLPPPTLPPATLPPPTLPPVSLPPVSLPLAGPFAPGVSSPAGSGSSTLPPNPFGPAGTRTPGGSVNQLAASPSSSGTTPTIVSPSHIPCAEPAVLVAAHPWAEYINLACSRARLGLDLSVPATTMDIPALLFLHLGQLATVWSPAQQNLATWVTNRGNELGVRASDLVHLSDSEVIRRMLYHVIPLGVADPEVSPSPVEPRLAPGVYRPLLVYDRAPDYRAALTGSKSARDKELHSRSRNMPTSFLAALFASGYVSPSAQQHLNSLTTAEVIIATPTHVYCRGLRPQRTLVQSYLIYHNVGPTTNSGTAPISSPQPLDTYFGLGEGEKFRTNVRLDSATQAHLTAYYQCLFRRLVYNRPSGLSAETNRWLDRVGAAPSQTQ